MALPRQDEAATVTTRFRQTPAERERLERLAETLHTDLSTAIRQAVETAADKAGIPRDGNFQEQTMTTMKNPTPNVGTGRFMNLTPHSVTVAVHYDNSGQPLDMQQITIPPSGIVARISEKRRPQPSIMVSGYGGRETDGEECTVLDGWCVCTDTVTYDQPENLPAPQEGIWYITSMLVAQAVRRPDVLSPGELTRDEEGRITGCKGLTRWT